MTETAWTWSLVLPPGWATLPTEAQAGRRRIRSLLDRALAHQPRDSVATARRAIEVELEQRLSLAAEVGAEAVHALVETTGGLPVTSALVGVVLTLLDDKGLDLPALSRVFGAEGEVQELRQVDLGGLSAIRRQRRRSVPLGTGGQYAMETAVDFVVDLPGGDDILALAFTTFTDAVSEALVELFDAMAGTLVISSG